MKYRRISHEMLYNNLQFKCQQLGESINSICRDMQNILQEIGFEKSNDNNWYYTNNDITLSFLWIFYRELLGEQIIYKRYADIPTTVCLLSNGKWKNYEIVFDYQHRTIMLFDENKLKIKSLQLGNPNKSSLEFNVHIQLYNDFEINDTPIKWACLILNHTWHFRTTISLERDYLSDYLSITWEDEYQQVHKDPLNPYLMTLREGIQYFKNKFQERECFIHGADELIQFICNPSVASYINNEDVLLHDLYKYLPHYPIIQIYWEIKGYLMMPYKRTVTERTSIPKRNQSNNTQVKQNQNSTIITSFQNVNNTFTPLAKFEQSQHTITSTLFQILKALPTPLYQSQCVIHKHELLICGGYKQRSCYSYHTIKNEYKFICNYPSHVALEGHCVVKLVENNKGKNKITLLSFGSDCDGRNKHTLAMKYVSVWSNGNDNEINKFKKSNNSSKCNKWISFTDNHNNPIIIDSYQGVRAVIGGINNHLLFITYRKNNINVFNLNTFQFIKRDTLPINGRIQYHCFVLKSENGMIKTNEENNNNKCEMILFSENTGLSIKYDEDNNTFQFHKISICDDIASLFSYACVCINGFILFFGGRHFKNGKFIASKSVYSYSIQENTWVTFENVLPIPLYNCFGILNADNTHIHIVGGNNNEYKSVSTNMKTKMISINEIKLVIQHWVRILKIRLGWINDFNKIIIKYIKGFQLLMILQGHDKSLSGVRFSTDCRKIVSASHDNTVRIWNVLSGKQLQIFKGHTDFVYTAKFSPNGRVVVSCSRDRTIRLWDVSTGTELMKLERNFDEIWDIDFSLDGRYIVSGLRDNTIRLWDLYSEIEMNQLGHSKGVLNTQFSPNGEMIVSSSNDKTICLWNVKSGEILKRFEGHSDRVMRTRFSPDSKFIVSCSLDNTIRIWNIETETEWKILKGHTDQVYDVQYFPDGQTIVSCSRDNTIQLWNIESEKRIQMLQGHSDSVKCIDVSRNGNIIISGSDDCKIRIWGLL
ncbi:WD-40 repeat protein [Reticulomyxa filosa]|uniref:WD-40 repeat protein n=1 Tax=Reticulomyxa filosa TaxID=46433 RepID=X6NUT9_RETFI|nr:WD-40 repeat protein [Reticulomyxa filosa]|eukprot:ETO30070.1 WD-40 repeat protein [Reticulomyxa filosa]